MTTGVIHDLGYQRYTGPRLGRGYAFRTLYAHTVRTAFGLGRGIQAKIFTWAIIGMIAAVGVVVTAIAASAADHQQGRRSSHQPMGRSIRARRR